MPEASMRLPLSGVLLLALLTACGGDSNEPEDPFPDAAGVYQVSGGFDDIPSNVGSFQGTLELTQASRSSGTLQGSAAILATLEGDVFNLSDPGLANANVSPPGVLSFTMVEAGATWTFSGTLSGTTITTGRHTLSDGVQSFSGNWQGNRSSGSANDAAPTVRRLPLVTLGLRLRAASVR
jgi:hypothetical protein